MAVAVRWDKKTCGRYIGSAEDISSTSSLTLDQVFHIWAYVENYVNEAHHTTVDCRMRGLRTWQRARPQRSHRRGPPRECAGDEEEEKTWRRWCLIEIGEVP
jgi:hypothetical protein